MKKEKVAESIPSIIEVLGDVKQQLKALKKDETTFVAKLKELIAPGDSVDSASFTATMQEKESKSFKPELIAWLKKSGNANCVSTVEVLNEEVLEDAIYNKVIPIKQIEKFQVITKTSALIVKEKK